MSEEIRGNPESGDPIFDLKKHGQDAAIKYLHLQSFYTDLAEVVARILRESLNRRGN
jgi:hypothetical protein